MSRGHERGSRRLEHSAFLRFLLLSVAALRTSDRER